LLFQNEFAGDVGHALGWKRLVPLRICRAGPTSLRWLTGFRRLIEELDPDNWGQGGITASEIRRRRVATMAKHEREKTP